MLQQGVPQERAGLGVGLRRAPALREHGEKGDGVALGPQVDIQLSGGLVDLLDRELAGDDALEKHPAGILLILLGFPVKLGQIAPVRPLALDFLLELRQHPQQGVLGDRLEEVAVHADMNGLPGVLKVVVSGYDNDFHLRKLPADQFAESQPVHKGHPDIRDEHIGPGLPDKGQGHLPVPGLPGEGVAVLGPKHRVPQGLPDDALVLH